MIIDLYQFVIYISSPVKSIHRIKQSTAIFLIKCEKSSDHHKIRNDSKMLNLGLKMTHVIIIL